jgi:bifunctional non-homologous end joining protein LigD
MPTVSPPVRRAGALPQVNPIALTPRADAFDDPDWLFEPKYDGFHGMIYSSATGCEIRFPPAVRFDRLEALTHRVAGVLGRREAIFDGDILALDRHGKPVFRDLLRGQGFLAFAAVDLLWLEGQDLRSMPLVERKRLLSELLPEDTGPLYKILTLEEHGRALYAAIKKMGLEGIVAKRKADPYDPNTIWYHIENPGYGQSEAVAGAGSRVAADRTRPSLA